MKNISLFQVIFIGVFVALGGIGLFVFGTYNGDSTKTASVGPVTIWGILPKTAVNAMISQSLITNPELRSVTYIQKRADTFTTEYINAAAEGKAPDLMIVSSDQIARLRNTLTMIPYTSISLRSFQDTFADAAKILLGGDGVYGFPLAIDPLILYYNRPLLATAGIAQPPSTWSDVLSLVSKFARVENGFKVTHAAIDLGGYANVHNARGTLSALFLQSGIPISVSAKGGGFVASLQGAKTQNGQTGVESALTYYTSFANPAGSGYTWNNALPDSRGMFLAGDLTFYMGFGSEYPFVKQANPNLDFDVAQFPQLAGSRTRTTYGLVYAFVIPKTSKNLSGAFQATSVLSGPAAEVTLVKSMGAIAPARRDLLAKPPTDLALSIIYNEALVAKSWLAPDVILADNAFAVLVNSIISGSRSVPEAVKAGEAALTSAYKSI
jgi:ABC-type glycerol-3-phosphate transport system substrate-binding protein